MAYLLVIWLFIAGLYQIGNHLLIKLFKFLLCQKHHLFLLNSQVSLKQKKRNPNTRSNTSLTKSSSFGFPVCYNYLRHHKWSIITNHSAVMAKILVIPNVPGSSAYNIVNHNFWERGYSQWMFPPLPLSAPPTTSWSCRTAILLSNPKIYA